MLLPASAPGGRAVQCAVQGAEDELGGVRGNGRKSHLCGALVEKDAFCSDSGSWECL